MRMRRFLPILFTLTLLAVLLAGTASAAGGPLLVSVNGPTALAPAQITKYNVTAEGGPTGNVSYAVVYYISGTNTTGGSPVSSSPGRTSGNRTTFQINITAPTLEQSLTLVVTLEATPKGGVAENVTTSYEITVIKPIVLTATFHNGATTSATNVTVRWYVDGALVGTTVIRQIAANADATASFDYLPVGLAAGQHSVRVEADLDRDGIIDPSRGEVVTSTVFYSQVQAPATGWTVLVGIGIFIPVFLAVVALRRRGQR